MSQLANMRPRSATEIIDVSFRFYREHIGELLVLSAILLVPFAVIGAIIPAPYHQIAQLAGNLMLPVCQGAIAVLVAVALEEGRLLSAGDALRRLGSGGGSAITVSIMSGVFALVGFVLLVIPGVLVLLWTVVAVPVAVLEGLTGSPALKRSRSLVRGHLRHVFGTLLLGWGIVFILLFGVAFALGLGVAVLGVSTRTLNLINGLLFVPLFPVIGVATTLLYYDLRVRGEGADITAMVNELAPAASPAPAVAAPTAAP